MSFDPVSYLMGTKASGGPSVTVEPLTVTENGEYEAPERTAYSPVTVNVPNSYTAADEGKVVSNGALVVQSSDTVTQNGEVDTTLINSLTVNVSSGGGGAEQKDVNFIDYDGTILYSYTPAEFAALTALPENPNHAGLTAQGWNWPLAKAQAYVAKYGKLWVGQMYITDDGKTRVYIHLEEGRLAPTCGFGLNGTAVIDWGDGSTDTVTGTNVNTVINTQHTYAAAGDYVITIDVTGNAAFKGAGTGAYLLWDNVGISYRAYRSSIRRVEIGSGITDITGGFYYCQGLVSVTIPNTVTMAGTNTFMYCSSLKGVVVPDKLTRALSDSFMGSSAQSCKAIAFPSSLTGVVGIDNSGVTCLTPPEGVTDLRFSNNNSLQIVVLPEGITSVVLRAGMASDALTSLTFPASMATINAYAFAQCYGLAFLKFLSTTPPTVAASGAFSGLPTDCIIYVPAGSLSAYTSATNYPSSSTYTYVEY